MSCKVEGVNWELRNTVQYPSLENQRNKNALREFAGSGK
jgi:hypothetical protein